jgi:hypothetical protein
MAGARRTRDVPTGIAPPARHHSIGSELPSVKPSRGGAPIPIAKSSRLSTAPMGEATLFSSTSRGRIQNAIRRSYGHSIRRWQRQGPKIRSCPTHQGNLWPNIIEAFQTLASDVAKYHPQLGG